MRNLFFGAFRCANPFNFFPTSSALLKLRNREEMVLCLLCGLWACFVMEVRPNVRPMTCFDAIESKNEEQVFLDHRPCPLPDLGQASRYLVKWT